MSEYEVKKYNYDPEQKIKNWNIAVGLQKVDHLEPSEYLRELAKKNVVGQISNREVEGLLYKYYSIENGNVKTADRRVCECDIVSNRIVELLETDGFLLQPSTLKSIHKYLFKDLYEFAGEFRTCNISKKENVLNGASVKYCNYFMIEDTLNYDFEEEKKQNYFNASNEEIVDRISSFTTRIWQVHPFMEGNTRTTAVFIERYLNEIGFSVNNDLFKDNAEYFRNALVRANYADYSKRINVDKTFLYHFFENLLFEGKHLLNDNMIISAEIVQEP